MSKIAVKIPARLLLAALEPTLLLSVIDVKRGPGGIVLKHPLSEITLLDVYRAVETKADDTLFRFHEHPNPECPVGKHIHDGLDGVLSSIQNHFEADLASHTLEEIYQNSTLPRTVSN